MGSVNARVVFCVILGLDAKALAFDQPHAADAQPYVLECGITEHYSVTGALTLKTVEATLSMDLGYLIYQGEEFICQRRASVAPDLGVLACGGIAEFEDDASDVMLDLNDMSVSLDRRTTYDGQPLRVSHRGSCRLRDATR